MAVLFVHTRFPGQFARLAAALMRDGHVVRAMSARDGRGEGGQAIAGLDVTLFEAGGAVPKGGLLAPLEAAVRTAASAARAGEALALSGFEPDIVYAHAGWGAGMFLRDVFPRARHVRYFEWYYNNHGCDADFQDPGRPLAARLATRALDLPLMMEFAAADAAVAPHRWQASQFPPLMRDRLRVIPDGVDTDRFCPDPEAVFELPDGRMLRPGDPVVTYVARGADPYRGFRPFLDAAVRLVRRRPETDVVVLGDRNVHYGPGVGTDIHFREVMADLGPLPERIHLLGRIPLKRYRRLMQVSRVHVHLSVPFVLSWSVLEAMACGAVLVGSEGPPLDEVLEHRVSGLLSAFGDCDALLSHVEEALAGGPAIEALRRAARATIVRDYAAPAATAAHIQMMQRLM